MDRRARPVENVIRAVFVGTTLLAIGYLIRDRREPELESDDELTQQIRTATKASSRPEEGHRRETSPAERSV